MKNLKLTGSPDLSEKEIQTALIRRLQARGWLVVRINSGAIKTAKGFYRAYTVAGMAGGGAGFPDVLALRGDGRGIVARLFEVKARRGVISDSQKRFATFASAFKIEVETVIGAAGLDTLEI
jgi:Holliday junction resolvase